MTVCLHHAYIALSKRQGRDDYECEAQIVLAQTMLTEQDTESTDLVETVLDRAMALADGMCALYFKPQIEALEGELKRIAIS